MKTFVLRPNGNQGSFQAGQYIPVRVVIDGVRHERYYSLTGRPGDRDLSICVKQQPGGLVSSYLHENIRPGDVLELGKASGEFLLPGNAAPLLFIAGGSGITPIYSLLRAAVTADYKADAVLLYYARSENDFPFRRELNRITDHYPHVRIAFIPETGKGTRGGRFRSVQLSNLVPDYKGRLAYVCGPGGLMHAVESLWHEAGIVERLRLERFGLSQQQTSPAEETSVHFRRSQRTSVHAASSLLETAEQAGLRPAYGCRMGICRTCICTKVSGTVRDRVTGELDQGENSRIRICISEPVGPVTLDI